MHTYLLVCIPKCLSLLIGSVRIDRFVVFCNTGLHIEPKIGP